MLIKPEEYNGQNVLKLSTLVALALDILALAQEVSNDPALLADVQKIYRDVEDLVDSLAAMEVPQVYQSPRNRPSEASQK